MAATMSSREVLPFKRSLLCLVLMAARKRLAAVHAELVEVKDALKKESSYLGIWGSDLQKYSTHLQSKEEILRQIVQQDANDLRRPPPGPPATFDRCSLPKVQQHMLDYEAVPSESTKALRALSSLAYNDVNELARSPACLSQLLRLLELYPEEPALQLSGVKCLCHLAFSEDTARRLCSMPFIGPSDVLDALMAARCNAHSEVCAIADEAVARIVAAAGGEALTRICRAEAEARGRADGVESSGRSVRAKSSSLPEILKSNLAEELLDASLVAQCFLEARPSATEAEAAGWLSLLVDLVGSNGGKPVVTLLSVKAATATALLMDLYPESLKIQVQGVTALRALAVHPEVVAGAEGVRHVESAFRAFNGDAELQTHCINFLVSVLEWPIEVQKQCEVDYLRVVSLTKEAMQRHVDVVSLQVAALSGLAKLVEALALPAESVRAGGTEGLIKTILAHHQEQKQVWTWGRILLDTLGLDRHWNGQR